MIIPDKFPTDLKDIISNGYKTEWNPVWSVIIRVITKQNDCPMEV